MNIYIDKEKVDKFPRFIFQIENAFLLRLTGINFTGKEFEPIYRPLIQIEKTDNYLYFVFNAEHIFIFVPALPFIIYDRITSVSLTRVEDL